MLTYTLIADGSSDECLIPIIDWILGELFPELEFSGSFATDLPALRHGLALRARAAIKTFPCDILLIHRDSESILLEERIQEITQIAPGLSKPIVPLVPIKMTEAWLIISEDAIRKAAGNPNGNAVVNLPNTMRIEADPNPKETLFKALRDAANLGARQMAKFNVHDRRRRVAECITDYSDLRKLRSFKAFESSLVNCVTALLDGKHK